MKGMARIIRDLPRFSVTCRMWQFVAGQGPEGVSKTKIPPQRRQGAKGARRKVRQYRASFAAAFFAFRH
jgi:hypothetical protein